MRASCVVSAAILSSLILAVSSQAQPPDGDQQHPDLSSPPEPTVGLQSAETPVQSVPVLVPPPFTLGAYVEAFYQWNFNRPSNGITNYRGFDNRHNTFTLANVAVDAQWELDNVFGRLTLQVGHTPSTYYLAEPQLPGSSGANATGIELWKYIQQAYAGYRFTNPLTVSVGVFLSPIGPESMAVRDNWTWSRSNLFFGLPFYHTGARATYDLSERWSFTLAAYNGWNSVVDGNKRKSLSTQLAFKSSDLTLSLLYFGGAERARAAPEGTPWRHLFDAHATWAVAPRVSVLAHGNAGFEPNAIGSSRWAAGALYMRTEVMPGVFVVARGDAFWEHVPRDGEERAAPIFWPGRWVASGTATIDYRPVKSLSWMLEYRNDQSERPIFFGRHVPSADAMTPTRRAQNTVTLGATAWF